MPKPKSPSGLPEDCSRTCRTTVSVVPGTTVLLMTTDRVSRPGPDALAQLTGRFLDEAQVDFSLFQGVPTATRTRMPPRARCPKSPVARKPAGRHDLSQ